jgi:SAM-dependent methyltransferase
MTDVFPKTYFDKQDPSDDELFYNLPRKVVHIDDYAVQQVSATFAQLLPPGGEYLDLMSSWRSHIPVELEPSRVVGLGMNADEMADNPQLESYVVQNLNKHPRLPFEDAVFDGVMCTVSVQYLQAPLEIFSDVRRVLRADAPFIVTFSNRCFPTKAVRVWLGSTDNQHMALVTRYFEASGGWRDIHAEANHQRGADPLYAVWAFKA